MRCEICYLMFNCLINIKCNTKYYSTFQLKCNFLNQNGRSETQRKNVIKTSVDNVYYFMPWKAHGASRAALVLGSMCVFQHYANTLLLEHFILATWMRRTFVISCFYLKYTRQRQRVIVSQVSQLASCHLCNPKLCFLRLWVLAIWENLSRICGNIGMTVMVINIKINENY